MNKKVQSFKCAPTICHHVRKPIYQKTTPTAIFQSNQLYKHLHPSYIISTSPVLLTNNTSKKTLRPKQRLAEFLGAFLIVARGVDELLHQGAYPTGCEDPQRSMVQRYRLPPRRCLKENLTGLSPKQIRPAVFSFGRFVWGGWLTSHYNDIDLMGPRSTIVA